MESTLRKPRKAAEVADIKLGATFAVVRATLLADAPPDRLDQPLAFWALPTDRRLPLAFMGRSLREILETPFSRLYATAGIGQKKMNTLVMLLARASAPQPPGFDPPAARPEGPTSLDDGGAAFDPTQVSDALWVEWQATVRDHGLESKPLGQFAPTLQTLPRVIWTTPLDVYLGRTLADIRRLKTHGEKRVNAILEVFNALHQVLKPVGSTTHLAVQLQPRAIARAESWLTGQLRCEAPIRSQDARSQEVRSEFVEPLLEQIRIDAGNAMVCLCEGRLGLNNRKESVRSIARQLDLTRARVYQLAADLAEIIRVRWPGGEELVGRFSARLQAAEPGIRVADKGRWSLFDATARLFFAVPVADAPDPSLTPPPCTVVDPVNLFDHSYAG